MGPVSTGRISHQCINGQRACPPRPVRPFLWCFASTPFSRGLRCDGFQRASTSSLWGRSRVLKGCIPCGLLSIDGMLLAVADAKRRSGSRCEVS